MIKSSSILNIVLISSLTIGIFLRLFNINYDNLWIDEMATFWVTDPNISIEEMFLRHKSTELAPQFYYISVYILHKIFGYDPSVGRYFSSTLGVISIFLFGYLVNLIKNNGSYKLSIILVSLNVFLITYSMEMRVYILLFTISITSLIFFVKYLNTKKIIFLFYFLFFQSIAAYTHPFSIIIFIGLLFLPVHKYLNKKNNDKILNLFLLFTGITVFLITFAYYYGLEITSDYQWNKQPSLKFYTNFYFSNYFGSRILGIFHLLILIYLIFLNKNFLIKNNEKMFLLLIILILSYLLPLSFGIYRPIITSKYIIFVLIPIISLLSILIYEIKKDKLKKILIFLFIFFTIVNQFTEQNFKQIYNERKFFKPQFSLALKHINSSQNNNYMIDVNFAKTKNLKNYYEIIYSNYLNFLSKSKNLKVNHLSLEEQKSNNINEIWIICSYLVSGDNCKNIDSDFKVVDQIIFKNLYLTLVKYN